ncbi:amino acid transporter [Rothia aerolata]|uniref:Amino acid transporter n=2 Tax=Rothia aerolata TaxID=1812262 RepID=A0A917IWX0_9MICC|nr:amino acid permease [Rothia aerolata]GGH66460.1 amino acid transporter [Rothia aerolata]
MGSQLLNQQPKFAVRTHNSDADLHSAPQGRSGSSLKNWLMGAELTAQIQGPHGKKNPEQSGHPWWQVMCLSGVDYFSTLGYQPAIAAVAAGLLSPAVTLVLVGVTLLGALPIYRRVAAESSAGAGSIHMLEKLLSRWSAKIFVLVLLGFTTTDFMITMTLSAADAAAHLEANPFVPTLMRGHHLLITLVLLGLLAAVFLRGFKEAIGVSVVLVGVFLGVNIVVLVAALLRVFSRPIVVGDWWTALTTSHGNVWLAVGLVVLVFPKIALGMSGFETGVVVMPQIRTKGASAVLKTADRVRSTQKLLTCAALIMSVLLLLSSFVTTLLIPQEQFQEGGASNGRALAYLAHALLGEGFGTFYDVSTIAILWFAGASAMSGLLNLVPRYLPRYGMAPEWARASRPLVLVFSATALLITLIFNANVDAQSGAYATGVLVLMTSAAIAVTLSARKKKQPYALVFYAAIALVFIYTTVANIVERPEGLKISSFFILAILVVSFVSRALRSYELRIDSVHFDRQALEFILEKPDVPVHVIAHRPDNFNLADYMEKRGREEWAHHIGDVENVIFLEIAVLDPSNFGSELTVRGLTVGNQKVLCASGAAIANNIASLALEIRDMTGTVPHIYLDWAAGSPFKNFLAYLFFGQGQVAATTHEVLRRAEPRLLRRPVVHVS